MSEERPITAVHGPSSGAIEQPLVPTADVCELVRQLAAQVAAWHEAGRWHGRIGADAQAGDRYRFGSSPLAEPGESVRLGDSSGDWDRLPVPLHRVLPVELPCDISLARERLKQLAISLDPCAIDVYALGTLLCQCLTDEFPAAFARSPRVRQLVPEELRPILERALQSDAQGGFATAAEFAAALGEVRIAAASQDTAPSFISSANKTGDTSAGRPRSEEAPGSGRDSNDSEAAPLPFLKLGHYDIIARLGRGGMGDVYLAYETALDRHVAIKVLPADLARSDEFVRRFKAEATAAAKLIHPNIIQIHFIGEDGGQHYFVMQYVAGESLASLLARREKLPVDETLAIVEQSLSGLAAAHEQGMVHRDIKPGNILLDARHHRALLADFGLVKSLESSVTGKTATGVVMGTVDYISPEQGRGQPVDGRSDLYSLGVLLYQMLSGRLPFQADSPTALVFQHVYETAPPLSEIAPHVPRSLATIIETLLAKSPADRYQSAAELLADLRAFRASGQAPSPSDALAYRPTTIVRLPAFDDVPLPSLEESRAAIEPRRWWERAGERALSVFRRHAPEAVLALQNTQLQVDGAVAAWMRQERSLQELANEAESVVVELRRQFALRENAAEEAGRRAAAEENSPARDRWLSEKQECGLAADGLQRAIADQEEQLATIRLRLAKVQARARELQNQRDILNARLKAAEVRNNLLAGKRPARRSSAAALRAVAVMLLVAVVAWTVWQIRTPAPAASSNRSPIAEVPVNSDPGLIASLTGSNRPPENVSDEFVPVQAAPMREFSGHTKPVRAVAFDRNGNRVASASDDGTVRIWDPETAGSRKVLTAHARGVTALAFSRDRALLVTGGQADRTDSRTLKLWDPETIREVRSFVGRTESVRAFAWSPDERVLAVVYADGLPVTLWNVEEGTEKRSIDPGVRPAAIVFSPDGSQLVFAGEDQQVRVWDLVENEVAFMLKGHRAQVTAVAFTTDGSGLFSGDKIGDVLQWDLKTGRSIGNPLRGDGDVVLTLAPSPNGRRLAVGGSHGVRVWDLNVRHVRKTLPGQQTHALAYGPDGSSLASGGESPFLLLWDARLGPLSLPQPATEVATGAPGALTGMAVTTMRSPATFFVGGEQYAATWNLEPRKTDRTLNSVTAKVTALAISPDGQLGFTGDAAGWLNLWTTASGELLHRVNVLDGAGPGEPEPSASHSIRCLAFGPDIRNLLVGTGESVFLWDYTSSTKFRLFKGAPPGCLAVAISPTGSIAATGGWDNSERTGEVRIWDMKTGDQLQRLLDHRSSVECLAFSPDGQFLASGSEDLIHVWNAAASRGAKSLRSSQSPAGPAFRAAWKTLVFLPDGRRLVSGGFNALSLWDVDSGEELIRYGSIAAGLGQIVGVAVVNDGAEIVSASRDGKIRTWPVRYGASKKR